MPLDLATAPNWVTWRLVVRASKPTKPPYSAITGTLASTTDPTTWTGFVQACTYAEQSRAAGVGYVLRAGGGIAGIDLDHVRDPVSGDLTPEAADVVRRLDSYGEVSPSGTGVHMFCRATVPGGGRRHGWLEAYSEARFLTVTGIPLGAPWNGSSVLRPAQDALDAILAQYAPIPVPVPTAPARPVVVPRYRTDAELLERAYAAEHGAELAQLYAGDTGGYPSRSEAYAALCARLVWWTGSDADRVDRLVRGSGLYDPKWDEPRGATTWGRYTLEHAIALVGASGYREHPTLGPEDLEALGIGGTHGNLETAEPGIDAKRAGRISVRVAPEEGKDTVAPESGGVAVDAEALETGTAGTQAPAPPVPQDYVTSLPPAPPPILPNPNGMGPPPGSGGQRAGFPLILTRDRHLRDVAGDALAALAALNDPPEVYVRGGALTRARRDEKGRPLLEVMGEAELRGRLARVADFAVLRRDPSSPKGQPRWETVPVPPPREVVLDVLTHGDWPFPALEAVVEAPVLREDGTILAAAGYDAATQLLYWPEPGLVGLRVPAAPTAAEVAAAVVLIDDLIGEFPFVDQASRANLWALLLTPILRPAIDGCVPLCLLDKPQAGTGASLLAEVAAVIATGRPAAMLGAPAQDDEWRKAITTVLLAGATYVVVDNAPPELGSTHLDRVITARVWEDRRLGDNTLLRLPQRATWVATGNNLSVRKDLARRCYWVRLDAKAARPWRRTGFRYPDALGHVTTHRGELLAALLTVARAWFGASRPAPAVLLPVLGGFDAWVRIVGGVLAHAGITGFLGNLDQLYDQADAEARAWEAFLRVWLAELGTGALRVAEVTVALLDPAHVGLRGALPDDLGDLLAREEAQLLQTKGAAGASFNRRLGAALARRADVRHGDDSIRLERAANDPLTGAGTWHVAIG